MNKPKTMREAGVKHSDIINYIVDDIAKTFNFSKSKAKDYLIEALTYNTVSEEIFNNIKYRIETGHQLDWSKENEETTYTDGKGNIKCFRCDTPTAPEDIKTINGAMYCQKCVKE